MAVERIKCDKIYKDLRTIFKHTVSILCHFHCITVVYRQGNNRNSERLIFLGSKITVDGDWSREIKRCFAPWKKSYDKPSVCLVIQQCLTLCKPRQHIKKQRHYFANEGLFS